MADNKRKQLRIPQDLKDKATKRQEECYCVSFNQYILDLIKLDVQKKLLK